MMQALLNALARVIGGLLFMIAVTCISYAIGTFMHADVNPVARVVYGYGAMCLVLVTTSIATVLGKLVLDI